MKVKELTEILQGMDPEAELITDCWNGHVDTYMAIDHAWEFEHHEIESDFFGTPGSIDLRVLLSCAEKFVFIGGRFQDTDERVFNARRVNCRLESIVRQHRSAAWKKEKLYQEVMALARDCKRSWFENTYG